MLVYIGEHWWRLSPLNYRWRCFIYLLYNIINGAKHVKL